MIDEFKGEYRWLSNFWYVNIEYEGVNYITTEHAYVAHKSIDELFRFKVGKCKTPGAVKALGRQVELRSDWDEVKLGVMEDITRLKYQDPVLQQLLLDTGDQEIIEGNTWGDTFWGVCDGVGENHLGKIIMKIRKELKNAIDSEE